MSSHQGAQVGILGVVHVSSFYSPILTTVCISFQPIQKPFVYFISANKNTFGIKYIYFTGIIYIYYRYLTSLFAAKKGCFGGQLRLILKSLNIVFYSTGILFFLVFT